MLPNSESNSSNLNCEIDGDVFDDHSDTQSVSQMSINLNSSISTSYGMAANSETIARKEKKCADCLRRSIDYFLEIKEPQKILFRNEQAYDHLNSILNITKYVIKKLKHNLSILNLLGEKSFVTIFVRLIDYGSTCAKKAVTSVSQKPDDDDHLLKVGSELKFDETSLNAFYFLNSVVQLTWCLTNFSKLFRQCFHQEGGSQVFLDYLTDQEFIENYLSFEKNADFYLNDAFGSLAFVKAIIGSLHNVSKTENFQGLEATSILLDFAHRMKTSSEYVMPVYMVLVNILTDKDIDELPDTQIIIQKLVQIISIGAALISNELDGLKRVKIELENGNWESVCVLSDEDDVKWDITELISGLYRIAVNDKAKSFIYRDCNLKEQTKKIIAYGNLVEKEYAIRLLYQLSFDATVATMINDDAELIAAIEKVTSNEKLYGEESSLMKYCKGLMWTIESKIRKLNQSMSHGSLIIPRSSKLENEKTNHREPSSSLSMSLTQSKLLNSSSANKPKQIMISYNSFSRDICMKIKKHLENVGFRIWIDVESMYGCSLEAMATAIESSDLILICMTQKYKMSPNCRAEAEYCFNIRKKYIPLIMESGYKPDGWLGLILGAKIFIDFTRYAFEDAIDKLKNELRQHLSDRDPSPNTRFDRTPTLSMKFPVVEKAPTQTPSSKLSPSSPKAICSQDQSVVQEWDRNRVKEWLNGNQFDRIICEILAGFDGEMLQELHSILREAPTYFYESINPNKIVSLSEVVRFSKEFKKLF